MMTKCVEMMTKCVLDGGKSQCFDQNPDFSGAETISIITKCEIQLFQ